MSADIVVIGSANYDYLGRGKKLPCPGETVRGDMIDEAPGGKGANQAVAAARLGARVSFAGRVGRDESGERILAALRREGVDITHVVRDELMRTGIALVQVDASGEKQILAVPGANGNFATSDVIGATKTITGAKVILLQLEVPLDAVRMAARIAHGAGVKVVLDPAPAIPLTDDLLELVDAIKPNASEAKILTGINVRDLESARAAGIQLIERGVGCATVAAGEEGVLTVWRGGEKFLPRLQVDSVDATGAGDAFTAGLGVAMSEGKPIEEASAFANVAAALATTVVGAQAGMPSRDAVNAFEKRALRRF